MDWKENPRELRAPQLVDSFGKTRGIVEDPCVGPRLESHPRASKNPRRHVQEPAGMFWQRSALTVGERDIPVKSGIDAR